jgi:citrate synthase
VAHWLWTGEDAASGPWRAGPEAVAAARAAQSGLPEGTLPLERLQVITVALATADPLRLTLAPDAVTAAGRNLIAGMVDALPRAGASGPDAFDSDDSGPPGSIAERLWSRLTAAPPAPEPVGALRSALVLLADHELAASTVAVRVAASVRADPYAAVGAGLGVLGGTFHGGASLGVEALFAEIGRADRARRVVGERLRRGERVPGFDGGSLYPRGDGRATRLLELVRATTPDPGRLRMVEAVLSEARTRRLPGPLIDFALAALAYANEMTRGAGEAIFAVARTAGWLAHALEEYARESPLRPRAVYTGPPPERP